MRIDQLQKEINRGLTLSDGNRAGEVIRGWSPNNLRRLIISGDCAWVQYHCVAQKSRYSALVNKVQFKEKDIREDVEKQNTDTGNLLDVLTKDRVCSNVEELIFVATSELYRQYPKLLVKDSRLYLKLRNGGINSAESRIVARFPRLAAITIVQGVSVQELMTRFATREFDLMDRKSLFCDYAEKAFACKVTRFNQRWWASWDLRPQFYTFDESDKTLAKFLNETRDYFLDEEKTVKLETVKKNKFLAVCADLEGQGLYAEKECSNICDVMTKMHEVYESARTDSRMIWASYFSRVNRNVILTKCFSNNEERLSILLKCNFTLLEEAFSSMGKEFNCKELKDLQAYAKDKLKRKDECTESPVESLRCLVKLLAMVCEYLYAIHVTSICGVIDTTRSSEFRQWYLDKIQRAFFAGHCTKLLYYSKLAVMIANKYLEIDYAGELLNQLSIAVYTNQPIVSYVYTRDTLISNMGLFTVLQDI